MNGTEISVALIGLAGLVLGYIVNAVLGVVRHRREDSIRSDEREAAKIQRKEESAAAEQRRLADLAVVAEQRDNERKHEADVRRRTQGELEAKALLSLLAELKSYFGSQPAEGYGTYPYNADLSRRIAYQLLLVPDSDIRALVDISLTVINETWVAEATGELETPGQQAQRTTLNSAMTIVGAYIVGNQEWDRREIGSLRGIKADIIDPAYDTYFASREA